MHASQHKISAELYAAICQRIEMFFWVHRVYQIFSLEFSSPCPKNYGRNFFILVVFAESPQLQRRAGASSFGLVREQNRVILDLLGWACPMSEAPAVIDGDASPLLLNRNPRSDQDIALQLRESVPGS